MPTFADILEKNKGVGPGFHTLRLILAVSILVWHSIGASYGDVTALTIWRHPLGRPFVTLVPDFFALSGFLVMGSALRLQSLRTFLLFRALRIVPALSVEVTISALVLGPLLTIIPLKEYFTSPGLFAYFGNLIGRICFVLPGVFETNPEPLTVNGNLWTVPPEILYYIFVAVMIITGVYKNRKAFTIAAILLVIINLYKDDVEGWINFQGSVSARNLVICFTFGNVLYLWRDRVPYNGWIFALCAAIALYFIFTPGLVYVALAAVTYCTVFIGLTPLKPPRVLPNGDFSYGIYLYGAPIQQSFVDLCPAAREFYWNILVCLPVTALVAIISWRYIESPALALRANLAKRLGAGESSWGFWKRFVVLVFVISYGVALLRFSSIAALRPLTPDFLGETSLLIIVAALICASFSRWFAHTEVNAQSRVVGQLGLGR